ncbi:hypothetical protein C8J56DRAFT_413603 [Mycena floridula]|nr:hypothetical protein C8J56DRAFT_413603 [Mycena floridula]
MLTSSWLRWVFAFSCFSYDLISTCSARLLRSRLARRTNVLLAGQIPAFPLFAQGSLAYIGPEKAIADLPFMNGNIASGGVLTYLFWRSAYLSTLFSLCDRTLVMNDWLITKVFGRDVSRE